MHNVHYQLLKTTKYTVHSQRTRGKAKKKKKPSCPDGHELDKKKAGEKMSTHESCVRKESDTNAKTTVAEVEKTRSFVEKIVRKPSNSDRWANQTRAFIIVA